MNFTYSYLFDEDNELLNGNITWFVPNFVDLSHWIHAEDVCKSVVQVFRKFSMKIFHVRN